MLYQRWREIARQYGDEMALQDHARGEHWTFSQLAMEAEKASGDGPVAYPQGQGFILAVLKAWRSGLVICPLEPDQKRPEFAELPKGCVHLKTTSATGGAARVVAFTAEQLAADAENIVATMGLRRDWPNLGAISLAHSYGFSNLVLPLLLHGVPLIVLESPLPQSIVSGSKAATEVTLAGVPALWRAWHDANAIPANVRLAISAGAPLPIALEQDIFGAHGLKVHNFYGSSECGGIAYDATNEPRNDAALAGTPMKNVNVSISEIGCIEVRSAAVGKTYWPEASAILREGCFRTSDLGEIVGGAVYLRGRAGDVINMAGRKISPETIEDILASHPCVRACLVFGIPSEEEERAETIVACVAAKNTGEEVLRAFLLERLPAWQVPRRWVFVESLNAGNRGKLSRAEWRKKYLVSRQEMTGS